MTEKQNPTRTDRTPTDLTSLLVELGRAIRGLTFYGEGAPACEALLDRAWLAFEGELRRAGELELFRHEHGFRATGIDGTIPLDHLDELGDALDRHGVERFRLTPDLTRDALRALLELLGRDPAASPNGGLARSLAARCNAGIVLNGGEDEAVAVHQRLSATPAVAPPTLGGSLLARSSRLIVEEPEPLPKSELDESPLEARASDETSERLLFRLIELDRCHDDGAYEFLARRIVDWAVELFDSGLPDECHRAVLVLADHAVGDGGRSGVQARLAQRMCEELAAGPRLEALIDRAASDDPVVSIRATQVLLQLGERSVPAIFGRLASGDLDPEARAQLTAALIAVGEPAVPLLRSIMRERDDPRATVAVRLAGELQHPDLVGELVTTLGSDRAPLRREAARALAHVGGDDAVHALVNGLTSEREELPEISAHCLAALGDVRAVGPLLAALERALRGSDDRRTREMIRALGQLGHDRAIPKLVALLERRALRRRRAMRELKLAALNALDRLPGREALRAVERATRHRDAAVRDRASELMAGRLGSASEREPAGGASAAL